MDPIIISVAPNGAKKTKDIHPNIPVTPQELAETAFNCYESGAAMIHLHIRDSEQKHTLDVNIYRETIKAIREKVGDQLIIQVTSEAVGIYTPEQQMEMVRALEPEAVSLAIRELVPDPSYEPTFKAFLKEVVSLKTAPQYILYSPEEIRYFGKLKQEGIIPEGGDFILLVLGKKTAAHDAESAYARPDDLDPYLEAMSESLSLKHTKWAVCAFGGYELDCMQKAIECGGHVRIGFENNHLLTNGDMAPDNASLIRQFCEAVRGGRNIADANTARTLLGMV